LIEISARLEELWSLGEVEGRGPPLLFLQRKTFARGQDLAILAITGLLRWYFRSIHIIKREDLYCYQIVSVVLP
jgi:hypothetical protein